MRTRSGYPHETEYLRLHLGRTDGQLRPLTASTDSLTQHPASRRIQILLTICPNFKVSISPLGWAGATSTSSLSGRWSAPWVCKWPMSWTGHWWRSWAVAQEALSLRWPQKSHIMLEIADRFYSSGQLHTVSYFSLIPVSSQSCRGVWIASFSRDLHPARFDCPVYSAQWDQQLSGPLLQAACSKTPGPGLKLAMIPFGELMRASIKTHHLVVNLSGLQVGFHPAKVTFEIQRLISLHSAPSNPINAAFCFLTLNSCLCDIVGFLVVCCRWLA